MSQSTLILGLSVAYLGLLFVIAHFGEQRAASWSRSRAGPIIYALSLAIYCTSWTFYGAVGRAATVGLDFSLIYVGPALVILFGWPVLAKIIRLAKRHNVTSIADFLAARYGKSRAVAVIVTLIATVGVVPYIALQLQAVSTTFAALAGPITISPATGQPVWYDTAFIVALLMAIFTILFGVRHVQASEQHRGMMLAIAFESFVKLAALLAVGPFVVWGLFDGLSDLAEAVNRTVHNPALTTLAVDGNWVAITLLSGLAFLCLPRQFHVAVVEHDHPKSLSRARWLFPLYMLLINLFVVPIALAGLALLGPGHNPDLFVLSLPLLGGNDWLSIFVFIGGLSAATSMVAVACMALSGMVGNELVMPLLLRRNEEMKGNIGRRALLVRRLSVVAILLAAYAYHRTIAGLLPLATIGMVSFCAVANFAPALVLGLYWRRMHRYGVIAGLAAGFFVWFAAVLWPTLEQGAALLVLPEIGPLAWVDPMPRGFLVALTVNIALLIGVSLLTRPEGRDERQAAAFVGDMEPDALVAEPREQARDLVQLQELAARFIGEERAAEAFAGVTVSGPAAYEFVERLLSGTIGAASARVVVGTARRRALWMPGSVREVLHDATAAIRYNADLLRKTLDHVGLGIAVFDSEGKLEIWNERFAMLVGVPRELLATGVSAAQLADQAPILAELTAWNAPPMRELRLPDGSFTDLRIDPLTGGGIVVTASDVTERVRAAEALRDSERRIRIVTDNVPVLIAYVDRDQRYHFTNRAYQATMRTVPSETEGRHVREILGEARYHRLLPYIEAVLAGTPQYFEIDFPTNDAQIEAASGTYLPHFDAQGQVVGFFLLYVDITERRRAEAALRIANESLERRVAQRTAELEAARARAEEANIDKTRFIAAASHDLLQPLHAARLFVAAMAERHPRDDLVEKIDHGLGAVESLLDALLDIAKLDAGAVKPEVRAVPVWPLLDSLVASFAPIAEKQGVELRCVPTTAVTKSDPALLRRVLQNFLSNAIRYSHQPGKRARVLLGCRRGPELRISVFDNGPGIAPEQQQMVFREFTRLRAPTRDNERGLGLGLAIVDRIARVLGHRIQLRSQLGKGSTFSITVPLAPVSEVRMPAGAPVAPRSRRFVHAPLVLCIDDEKQVREGMAVLLGSWGCETVVAENADDVLGQIGAAGRPPDLLLIDLHLGDGENGFAVIARLRQLWGADLPAALITATRDPAVVAIARTQRVDVLLKPVKPAQLRALIAQRAASAE
ncbi:NahK/ErcS family hybrid sensor histidine kinase/response regulator [Dongia deserti]|uniref:NahK/ErcS family hybrid sensor histidine kinase/response regulator n=1 Tax=Dongia deserti TaxID=2268030 RepID=UPI000E64B3A3|nr:NahK/ErcS family hybrid sensor histidine kinase/response regulator [Dongia deserti]